MLFGQKRTQSLISGYALALILLLAGCSGGGGGGSDPTSDGGGGDTADTAIQLTYPGSFPKNASMPLSEGRYYDISGLQPGYQYKISLTTTDPLWMMVGTQCIGTSCMITAQDSGEISVHVAFTALDENGASFTLNVEEMTHEGTLDAPKDLSGLMPYTGTAKEDIYNYYVLSGLTPGNSYTVGDDGVSVYIYQDQFGENSFSNSNDFTAAGDTIWLRVWDSSADTTFTLTLTDNGLADPSYTPEGSTATPIELALDTLYDGQTDNTASYYHISGLEPGKEYGIGLDKLSGETTPLVVYNTSGYTTEVCRDDVIYFGENLLDCVAAASGTGELWIAVDGSATYRLLGSSYQMMVYTLFPDEGTSSENKQLSVSDLPYSGTVDKASHYTLSGLEPNVTYITTITGYDSVANLRYDVAKAYNWMAGCVAEEFTPGTLTCSSASHPDDGTLAFEVNELTDYKGTVFTLDVVRADYQSEGSTSAPVQLTLDTTHNGEVGAMDSYYELTGLTPGQAYTITATGLPDFQHFYVYETDSYSSYICRDWVDCTVRATTTSIWLRVEHDDHIPVAFTLTATLSAYQAEGTVDQPVSFGYATSYQGMVDPSASYYELTGLTPGETYVVTVTGVSTDGSLYMYLYDDLALLGSTAYGEYKCSLGLSSTDKYCEVTPSGSSVWIMVDGTYSGSGALYTFNSDVALQQESKTLDYAAAAFPYSGMTNELSSTYTVAGLLPYQYYDVTLTNLSADLRLSVSGSFSSDLLSCTSETGTTDEACGFTTGSDGAMSITVSGSDSLYGGTFTLGVTSGPENQGTSASPVELGGAVTLPYNGEVSSGASYYKVINLTPDTFYAVSLDNLTNAADLYVYDSSGFSTSICTSIEVDTTAELCGATSNAAGELYVKVDGGYLTTGATYTLDVTLGPASEGTQGGEVSLAYGTDLPYADGSVDTTASYYVITSLSGNTDYTITLTNLTGDVAVTAYPDNTYTYITGTCSASAAAGETLTCTMHSTNGGSVSAYIEVSGSNSKAGATYNLNVTP